MADGRGGGGGRPGEREREVGEVREQDEDHPVRRDEQRPFPAAAQTQTQAQAQTRLTKAARLGQLAREMAAATDNAALARLVRAFVGVMQENRSKMLTKEGFAVLDALHKQLADPSVFVAPQRSGRRARASGDEPEDAADRARQRPRRDSDEGEGEGEGSHA